MAVSEVGQKNYLFSINDRIQIVEKALYSDLKFKKNQIKVSIGHKKNNILNSTIIVYSSAIKMSNPEILEAKRKKLPDPSNQHCWQPMELAFGTFPVPLAYLEPSMFAFP